MIKYKRSDKELRVPSSLGNFGGNASPEHLDEIAITENGTYVPEEGHSGWNKIDVNVPDKYDEGYDEGYNAGEVDGFNTGYGSGYTEGKAYQRQQDKNDLRFKKVTKNGVYEADDDGDFGYHTVEVNVPSITTEELTALQYEELKVKDPMVIYCIKG